jgi:DNA polymerase-3 subunit gamma/tau
MDNFVVSARKYRPATFDTVVGQGHITSTLKNAIKSKHLAQAFLFCGPRGVGKTTCARILAKTINCFNLTENTEACDVCDSCTSFNSGQSLNVYELDAASNNSVDDIRNLIDQVRFAPQLGKHKVYIIDEVHMLSQAAFNAFLKTLEEPPAHAIFILATTEKHKIIPTILSRCQSFDFNRIQVDDITSHLLEIAKKENITADENALHIISQKADGGLRDALSMFDQIVSFAGNNITYKAVIDNLNILDYDYYFKITDTIISENISQSLLIFNEILDNGFDGHNFINGLGEHFRNLLVSKDTVTIQLLEVSKSIKEKYNEQSQKCSIALLINLLKLSNEADYKYKTSKNQRLLVELSLIQMSSFGLMATESVAEKKNDQPKQVIEKPIVKTYTEAEQKSEVVSEPAPMLPNNVPVEEVKVPVKKFQSSTSISSSLNKPISENNTNTTIQEIKTVGNGTTPFSEIELMQVWDEFANNINKKEMPNFYASFTQHKPELKENYVIQLKIENVVQQKELTDERFNILSFLRSKLKNDSIDLVTYFPTVDDSQRKPYTNTEKYKRMQEINPNVEKLRQSLDLDF